MDSLVEIIEHALNEFDSRPSSANLDRDASSFLSPVQIEPRGFMPFAGLVSSTEDLVHIDPGVPALLRTCCLWERIPKRDMVLI